MVDHADADTWQAKDETARGAVRAAPEHFAATIVYHPDPTRVGERALLVRQESAAPLSLSRSELLFALPSSSASSARPLEDPYLSRAPISLAVGERALTLDIPERVSARLAGRAVTGEVMVTAEEAARGVPLALGKRVTLLLHRARVGARPDDHGLTGSSGALDDVRHAIGRVADLDVPVLLLGETGSGKERVAQAIHRASQRAGACVVVNVATLSPTLATSELFGHEKGAFTGAERARVGLFARAHEGTLFLDEIGELPEEVQPMLLRALDASEVRPVGAKEALRVDARIVAATDADLEAAVRAGRLRPALYHRLRGFEITMPPLRARREDIPGLILALLDELLDATGERSRIRGDRGPDDPPWIDRALVEELVVHPWPGNVRQLRSVLRQVVVASRGEATLRADAAVQRALAAAPPEAASPAGAPPSEHGTEAEIAVEPATLRASLEAHGYSFGRTARALGVSRSRLYRMAEADPEIRTGGELSREELEQAVEAHRGDLDAMVRALRVSRRAIKLRLSTLGITWSPPS